MRVIGNTRKFRPRIYNLLIRLLEIKDRQKVTTVRTCNQNRNSKKHKDLHIDYYFLETLRDNFL